MHRFLFTLALLALCACGDSDLTSTRTCGFIAQTIDGYRTCYWACDAFGRLDFSGCDAVVEVVSIELLNP